MPLIDLLNIPTYTNPYAPKTTTAPNPYSSFTATTNPLMTPKPINTTQVQNTLGITAKSPTQNITAPTNTLTSSQSSGIVNPQLYYGNATGTPTFTSTGQPLPASTPNAPSTYSFSALSSPTGQGTTPYTPPATSQNAQQADPSSNTPNTPAPAPFAPNQGLYGQLIAALANAPQNSPQYKAAMDNYNAVNQKLQESRTNEANALAGNSKNPIPLEFQQGRAQVLQNQYLGQQGALGSELQGASNVLGAANTNQGLLQQALQQASSLAAPVAGASFFGSPMSGGLVGTPGANGSTGNSLIDTNVQQALKMVRSGASVNDPQVQTLLSISPLAQQSFNSAMQSGGGYNPTAQSAAALQNINQGITSQGQANNLQLGLSQIQTIEPLMISLLSQSGMNSAQSPSINDLINKQIGIFGNPGAVTQYQNMLNELQNYSASILSSGVMSGTPTGVQAATDLQNPGLLNPQQLKADLDTLKTLGTNKLSVLQGNVGANLGNNSGAYAGNPAEISSTIQASSPSTFGQGLNTKNVSQAGAGAEIGVASSLWSGVSNFAGELMGFIGRGLMGI